MSRPQKNALRRAFVEAHPSGIAKLDKAQAKKLNALAKKMAKEFGATALIRVNEAEERDVSDGGISTGYGPIDDVLTGTINKDMETVEGSGIGFPRGRIIEIMGGEASGKTSLALMAVVKAQAKGELTAFVDAEHALDTSYARKLGVNVEEMLLSQPDSGEEALNMVETYVKEGVRLVIVDSVAALVPEKELKGEMGDSHMGQQARLMSQACRKLTPLVAKHRAIVIFINQIRMKLGVMFGNPETTSGGNALKFYASIRCNIKHLKKLTKTGLDGERQPIGVRVKMETIKNKVAPPFRHIIYDILFHKGVRIPSKAQIKADKLADAKKWGKK